MPGLIDTLVSTLPYSNVINGGENINKKYEVFSNSSITKEEKIQRLSVVNQFDNQMASSNQSGMWINSLSELLHTSDSNDKTRRIDSYRQMSTQSELGDCVREICNEFITKDENGRIIQFALRGDYNEEIKEEIKEQFYKFIKIFDFEYKGWEYMKSFLIEGELFFENIVSIEQPERGIIGLTRIAADRIDPYYHDIDNELIEFFILRKKMMDEKGRQFNHNAALDKKNQLLFLNEKQVSYVHSGEWDRGTSTGYGITGRRYRRPHIDNSSRHHRQLALIEDATIIYMLVRAPERLVFNIDTGHLPPGQSEAYVKRQMAEFWNRKAVGRNGRIENVYDPMTLLENYYFAKPRGADGSTVTSIGGGSASPDNMDLLNLFINRLYKSMGVPLQRLNPESGYSDGMDITREELRFAEFIIRLQQRFAQMLKSTFITHLKLKGRKLTRLAKKFDIIQITDSKSYYDFSNWNSYDEIKELVYEKAEEHLLYIKEQIDKNKEKLSSMNEELKKLETLVLEQTVKEDRVRILAKEYTNVMKDIKALSIESEKIKEDSESIWSQFELREEDVDLEFNKPNKFYALKEQEMFQLKFESYSSMSQDDLISSTLSQKTFLGWSDKEIAANREYLRKDAALRWELSQIESGGPDFREQMAADAMGGGDGMDGMDMGGGLGGDIGGDIGGGDAGLGGGAGTDTELPEFGAEPTDSDIQGQSEPPAPPGGDDAGPPKPPKTPK